MNFKAIWSYVVSFVEITIGCFITAMAINLFLAPYNIAPGGVSGIAIVIHYLFKFPIGITMLFLNVPLFIFGVKQLGGMFGAKTLYGTIILSIIIDLTSNWPIFKTEDILLTSIFGGIIMGIGLGIVFRSEATTGGTDLAARIAKSFLHHFPVGQLMFVIDASVVLLAMITLKSIQLGLYAILTIYITARVVDTILEGANAKGAFIISEHANEISSAILNKLERGVTGLKGMGMYTGQDKNVLLVVVNRTEIMRLKQLVHSIDEKAFIILTDVNEVHGEGF